MYFKASDSYNNSISLSIKVAKKLVDMKKG